MKVWGWVLFFGGVVAALVVAETTRSSAAFIGTIFGVVAVLGVVWAVATYRNHRNAASGRRKLWGLTGGSASGINTEGGCGGGSDGGGGGCGGGCGGGGGGGGE